MFGTKGAASYVIPAITGASGDGGAGGAGDVSARTVDQVEDSASKKTAKKLQGAHFIGHSFGTIVLSWVMNQRPELVSFASFLDPV